MYAEQFTHERWSGGSLATFGLETRYDSILEGRTTIRRYAVGYCPGESLFFRAKEGTVAVMFWTEKTGHFWTHLTREEFDLCFPRAMNTI